MITQAIFDEAARTGAEVWLLPSGDRPDKTIGVDRSLRLRLIEAMIQSVNAHNVNARIETYELESKQQTETTRTASALQTTYPDCSFRWVFGSDSVATMHEWGGGDVIYETFKMLIVARPGYSLPTMPPCGRLLRVDTPQLSSTEVRNRLLQGESVDDLVPNGVAALLSHA